MLSDSNARLVAARQLTSRRARRDSGLFLAEGLQSVREALSFARVTQIFVTQAGLDRHRDLLSGLDVAVDVVSEKAAAGLSETVSPQGLVAVCRIDAPADVVLAHDRLVVALVDANDPGNAGTILRTADAAGASTVIFSGDSVDPYNGKCVRASAGSIFHVRVCTGADSLAVIAASRTAGLLCLATSGSGKTGLDELVDHNRLTGPTLWIFGNEAHGLPDEVIDAADLSVRVPIYGGAESLNLSAAAAVCLYASAREQAR